MGAEEFYACDTQNGGFALFMVFRSPEEMLEKLKELNMKGLYICSRLVPFNVITEWPFVASN